MAAFAFCRVKRHIITAFGTFGIEMSAILTFKRMRSSYQLKYIKKGGLFNRIRIFVSFCASEAGTKHRRVRRPFPDETAEDGSALTPGFRAAAANLRPLVFKITKSRGIPRLSAAFVPTANAAHTQAKTDSTPSQSMMTVRSVFRIRPKHRRPPERTRGFRRFSLSRRPHSVGPDDCRY